MSASIKSKIGTTYIYSSAMVSAIIILSILIILFVNSYLAMSTISWDLFTTHWNPPTGQFGIVTMVYGTIMVTLIAMVFATPIGVLTAIYTSEILPSKYRILVKSFLELLAGIPSIIYGLIGVAFFSVLIGDLFHLQSGRVILTGGILLAIMILPTIITLTDDALNTVPNHYRENGIGLGLYKYEIIQKVVLPIAKSDIVGAVLLALGRAMGETMAVMLVIGSIDRIARPFYNVLLPGQTITSKLGREIGESAFGSIHFSAMIFMGFILLLIVLTLTTLSQKYIKKEWRLYD